MVVHPRTITIKETKTCGSAKYFFILDLLSLRNYLRLILPELKRVIELELRLEKGYADELINTIYCAEQEYTLIMKV
jgi:hypothetical protein